MHGSKRQPMISSVPKFWQHLIANDADDPLTGRCGRFGLADWNKKQLNENFCAVSNCIDAITTAPLRKIFLVRDRGSTPRVRALCPMSRHDLDCQQARESQFHRLHIRPSHF